ncbi:hypothetical protein GGR57DRAFT_451097 [Xylariaceae sp. FL1272]|nr:hypothetical protein GGR57DRAFT_451097 [Xylariaceae sp. FL1272]
MGVSSPTTSTSSKINIIPVPRNYQTSRSPNQVVDEPHDQSWLMVRMAEPNRYIANTTAPTLSRIDIHKELIASLARIVTTTPPVHTCSTGWSFSGFYTGPTSIALLFYKLSHVYPDLELGHQALNGWAEQYLQLGARLKSPPPDPSHCGIGNETLAHLALSAVMNEEPALIRQLCSYASIINSPTVGGSNEWLYGRAGYLYLLRLCQTIVPDNSDPDTTTILHTTISSTVDRILSAPRPWTWHGKEYLGAVHGRVGIITQILLSKPSIAPRLAPMLSDLLKFQFPSGNFPSSLPPGSDKLVQLCHGGPGFVISLRTLLPLLLEMTDIINRSISNAQSDIWQRGLLTKEPCLCHGIAGNALALDPNDQFIHFLSFMTSENIEPFKDHRRRDCDGSSLYTGEAGRAWSWAVADKGLPKTCIGYNDV